MYIIDILNFFTLKQWKDQDFLTHLMTKYKIHEIIEKNLVINFDISTLKIWNFKSLNYCLWKVWML